MKGLKTVMVISTVVAIAAALSACQKAAKETPFMSSAAGQAHAAR